MSERGKARPDARVLWSRPQAIVGAIQWRYVLLTLTVAVSFLALAPSLPASVGTGWDKLNHMIAFAALAVSACRGFSESAWRIAFALLTVLAFGVAIEVLQLLVEGRSAERGDLLADAIGTGAGALLALVIWPATRRMRSSTRCHAR